MTASTATSPWCAEVAVTSIVTLSPMTSRSSPPRSTRIPATATTPRRKLRPHRLAHRDRLASLPHLRYLTCRWPRMAADRNQIRATFDSAADTYQESRPDYPGGLYDD